MADGHAGVGGRRWAPIAVVSAVLIGLWAGAGSGTSTASTSTTDSRAASTTASASTTVVTSSSTAPSPLSACPGHVVRQRTDHGVTLKLYYDSRSNGVNCVSAVHDGTVVSPGYLQTELTFATSLTSEWPDRAWQDGPTGAAEVNGTYLVATDNRCVTAVATYFPAGRGGPSSSVSLTRTACG